MTEKVWIFFFQISKEMEQEIKWTKDSISQVIWEVLFKSVVFLG